MRATRYYTESDDALTQSWAARSMWMNPPYAGRAVAAAMNALMDRYAAGSSVSPLSWTNNYTETRWHQRALRQCSAICLTDHRISFWAADGKARSANTRGQSILFGDDCVGAFAAEFGHFGAVLRTYGAAEVVTAA